MAYGTRLRIKENGEIDRIGIDDGSAICTLVQWRFPTVSPDDSSARHAIIVVKVPGGSYFAGRGSRGYAGAQYVTYRIMGKGISDDIFICHELCYVPIRSDKLRGSDFIKSYENMVEKENII